ncbi:competence type IV pilus major pilin ComGC [Tepidibacillus fermentans]|uniref:Competence protein ComGC n=1 Tax=Tepidibacillus fermentans TaxID=1281767 RepID=A0A4R3KJP2_9BACI|nr:prepilin-type N-terminal cleavage/methylation domain-containing protein [Tepidibacillus fermentans]TCS83985.1 competence protein ComGC [Tepidibacillus fermentans]
MKMITSVKKNNKGFTLIEILVVIFIIGIILAIATPNLKASGEKAQKKACLANQKLIQVQLENYYLEHHAYPNSSTFVTDLAKEGLLNSVITCPSGGTYSFDPNYVDPSTNLTRVKVSCSIASHNE